MKKQWGLVAVGWLMFSLPGKAQLRFPLRPSEDLRYLIDQDNHPTPILGRTAWFIISLPDSSRNHFIQNTLEHGHNAIEMSVLTHWRMGNHAPLDGNGNAPFTKDLSGNLWYGRIQYQDINKESPDLLFPHEPYWRHVDSLLGYCEDHGILVLMFPAYVGYSDDKEDQGWMKELVANGTYRDSLYGAWIAHRYKNQKNLVWMLLGDKGRFTPAQAAAEGALIKGLKSVSGQASVLYSAESQSGENAADNPQFGKEMNLNGSYSWDTVVRIQHITRKAFAHQPRMPAFLLEEPYDEEGPDGNHYNPNAMQPVRRFQWWGWLNTIGGYMSGNGYIWQFLDGEWQNHLNTQAALDMQRMNAFIRSIPWWTLRPAGLDGAPELIENNAPDSSEAFIAADLNAEGSILVAYLPPAHAGSIALNIRHLQPHLLGYWFDPTSGHYFPIKAEGPTREGLMELTPPGLNSRKESDWVLLFSRKEYQ